VDNDVPYLPRECVLPSLCDAASVAYAHVTLGAPGDEVTASALPLVEGFFYSLPYAYSWRPPFGLPVRVLRNRWGSPFALGLPLPRDADKESIRLILPCAVQSIWAALAGAGLAHSACASIPIGRVNLGDLFSTRNRGAATTRCEWVPWIRFGVAASAATSAAPRGLSPLPLRGLAVSVQQRERACATSAPPRALHRARTASQLLSDARGAVIFVRQSTAAQVLKNTDVCFREAQFALQRAYEAGLSPRAIVRVAYEVASSTKLTIHQRQLRLRLEAAAAEVRSTLLPRDGGMGEDSSAQDVVVIAVCADRFTRRPEELPELLSWFDELRLGLVVWASPLCDKDAASAERVSVTTLAAFAGRSARKKDESSEGKDEEEEEEEEDDEDQLLLELRACVRITQRLATEQDAYTMGYHQQSRWVKMLYAAASPQTARASAPSLAAIRALVSTEDVVVFYVRVSPPPSQVATINVSLPDNPSVLPVMFSDLTVLTLVPQTDSTSVA